MSIGGISGLSPFAALSSSTGIVKPSMVPAGGTAEAPSFSARMSGAIDELARSQMTAADSAKAYELGQTQDLAGVMINQQVSQLGFQLALNVRNKALGAYRDIMNMPV